MRNTIVALCMIAVVVVVGVFLLDEDGSAADGGETARCVEASPSTLTTNQRKATEGTQPRGEKIQTSPYLDQPTSVPRGRRVRVIDGETGEAVSGAVVEYVDPERLPTGGMMPSFVEHGYVGHLDRVRERFGLRFTCDESGETRVPRGGRAAFVTARTPDKFGIRIFGSVRSEVVTLELRAVGIGRIQTLGLDGSPMAGVPVAVENVNSHGSVSLVYWRGVTRGSRAMVRLRDIDAIQRQVDPLGLTIVRSPTGRLGYDDRECMPHYDHQLRVTLAFPVRSPPGVILKDDRFPAEPIRLQVPATGRVIVNVTEPRDRPLRLHLHIDDPGVPYTPYARAGMVQTSSKNGRAVFELVGPGLPLRLLVQDPREVLASKEVYLQSPLEPGEDVEIDVALERPGAAVVGRIVDAEGKPVANRQAQVLAMPVGDRGRMWPNETTAMKTSALMTDAHGRFRVGLDEKESRSVASGPLVVALGASLTARLENPGLRGQVEIGGPFPPGETDIGDVVVAAPPIALTGRVVDQQNRPLADVEVSLHSGRTGGSATPVRVACLGDRTVTDEDGGFVLRSSATSGEWRIRYGKDGLLPPEHSRRRSLSYDRYGGSRGSVSARIGERDHVLVLIRTGAIEGSILLDQDVDAGSVAVFLESGRPVLPQTRGARADELGARPDAGGRFEFHGLRAGRFDLRIEGRRGSGRRRDVLHTIRGVLVESGVTNRDARLQGVDLTGELASREVLNRFVLRVWDPRGRPLPTVIAQYWPRIGPGRMHRLTGEDGSVTILTTASSLRATLIKSGYQEKKVQLEPGDNEIAMVRAYLIHVTLLLPLKVDEGLLWVKLSPDPGPDLYPKRGFPKERKRDWAWSGTFSYPHPGRYRLTLGTTKRERRLPKNPERRAWATRSIQIGTPRFIEVCPDEFEKQVRIEITEEELGEALQGGS